MSKPGKKRSTQGSPNPGKKTSPSEETDRAMTDFSSDSKILLSCWWSRGPSGQVEEWEARPTTTQSTPKSNPEPRARASRRGSNPRNKRMTKT